MGAIETPDTRLDEARTAAADRAWGRAYELFTMVATRHALEPEDLDRLAKSAYWTGKSNESITIREAAYAAYIERGDDQRAAFCALTLQRQHLSMLQDSVAAAWLRRAERVLADGRGSVAHGYLAIAHADAARALGDFIKALALVDRAREIADRSRDGDLGAWAEMRRGMFLADQGRVDEGWSLMEEVAATATGGERGTFTTGAIFANMASLCRDLAEYRRGSQWCDVAMRWCERRGIIGFPGIYRTHRGEVMRMLGDLQEAERETLAACKDLEEFSPAHAGAAHHELGEVRLRLGDLASAEEAFRRAREFGEDPQPGLALLHLERGDVAAAATSIARSLQAATFDRFARARMLPAQAEIARAADNAEIARAARNELSEIAGQITSPAIRAAREWAAGVLALVEGDAGRGVGHLRDAGKGWSDVGTPYEAAKAEVMLARAHLADGDEGAAAVELEMARATFERLGARLEARRTTELRARIGGGIPSTRAVRTFLFTDIVGSTSLIAAIGDEAWEDLRRWHDQALRATFADHGGEEIDHAGDGFFLAFPTVTSAVACAIEIQRRLGDHRRTHGFAPQVRIGLHATAATRDEESYTGLGVHAAARIGALAGAGEILASVDTLEVIEKVRTMDRRTVRLKGIDQPVDVVSIDWRSSLES